jgi:acyl-CoA synthetase (AMP-forming)/AMP-acid ligase II
MINTRSCHVHPREVEDAIRSPAAREVAVVGEADPKWCERVVAYVVADAAIHCAGRSSSSLACKLVHQIAEWGRHHGGLR